MCSMAVTASQLISMPEIAELAGVRRPVVTTWRRRHVDFPTPVVADRGRSLFDARQVIDWLVDSGRADRRQIEPDLRLHLLTCLSGDLGARASGSNGPGVSRRATPLGPRELTASITALICLRHLDDEPLRPEGHTERHVIAALRDRAAEVDWDDELLRAEIDALPRDAGWLAGAVDELIEAAWGCAPAYERTLAARRRLDVLALYANAVTPMLAKLIVGLSGAREHADRHSAVHIADPAAEAGDLLLALRDEIGEEATVTFAGAEADPFLARITRRRLVVHGVPERDRAIEIGAELSPNHPAPDVLMLRLPYLPAEDRAAADPLAAVTRAVEALGPGQTAIVLGPADLLVGALPAYQAAGRTRNELLASGRVEAVVRLPGGLVPFRPGYQTALWVLRHEEPLPEPGRVLLADVADRPLTDRVVDTLTWDIVTWRRNGHRSDQHLRAFASQVAISDVRVPRRPLVTRRPAGTRELSWDGGLAIAQVAELEVELDRIGQHRPRVRSGLATRGEATRAGTQPIGALVRSGQLVLKRGARIAAGDVSDGGHHRVLGAAELTGEARVGSRMIDRSVLAERYPHVKLTEPDDVVVTLTPHFGVHHDERGFSVVEFPTRVLRVPAGERERFTPRVLAALLAANPAARAGGAVRAASRLADLQLPLLPPAEVARLDALLELTDARRRAARRELDLLDELRRLAVSGVTDGELTITDAPSSG